MKIPKDLLRKILDNYEIYCKMNQYVFPQPLYHRQKVTQSQFFKQTAIGLNSEFSVSQSGYRFNAK